MNEVHWSDPEFQEWERSQLGEYFEREMEQFGEPVKYFRHFYPNSHFDNREYSPNYRNPIFSLKSDGGVMSQADSARTDACFMRVDREIFGEQ